ncbi:MULTISPECIES: phospholipid carrier-dependent glycosyltransferase [unclassified Streptomyces]|uniref:phospholipid carrier-dependent glycosyltransferase n=1 Tax=unclassified Streptomyces TaxID=2593676 RepID=UPI00136C320E|nr:phospholipid carrier-dependent glycosyltransferase [Streptomyces sp. SID335]MYZ16861.1 phospholipid carrier-dependent glycosyltransferase [Streptomyces sp. SID337]NDZ91673.1 phospholipid carrier-dependent glycosyltransferase [Streptomyces sp. SID10115]NEA05270.1 phospholipid carrier-dependent glycosyltransferase [Streptomyces sp. SID10116]NEB49205.1 phospholipid carrier-dependent glycosyltransferase [Streptomyces sp. SID339]
MTSTASSPDTREGQAAEEQQPPWQRRLRRFGHVERPRQDVRARLVPAYTQPSPRLWMTLGLTRQGADLVGRWAGWVGPLLITLVAGVTRFWNLGNPKAVIFDETYYAKDAWALIHRGFEVNWPEKVNGDVLKQGGDIAIPHDASYVVHPPVGKYVIGVGEWLFGFDPFGWRFMTAVLGTLSVLMLCRIGRRLFRSTFLGCLAGGLLAVDGLHFVMSRTALLDQVLMFFVLAAFGCFLIDRDKARARLAAALPSDEEGRVRPDVHVAETLRLGWRPWRWAAGLCLGLAFGTKWNGLYVMVFLCLMTVFWDVGARRVAGARRPHLAVLRRDVLPAFVSTVPVALATYVVSWLGWILSPTDGTGGYYRNWAATAGKGGHWTWLPDWVRSLWHYEHAVYEFHVGLSSPHTYQSNPWSWIVDGRPVSYFYESPLPGKDGCPPDTTEKCAREVLALGTPLLWWAAAFALLYVLWRWAFRRDWRAGAILCGVVAGYLPWFFYQERTIFYFYAVVFVPFLCLAVAMTIGAILGPPGSSERRRVVGAAASGVLVLLILWNFIYFWPIYTGTAIPIDSWRSRMWLDTWV